MAYSGYPTPDNQIGDATFSCVPIFVPSNPEFQSIFASIIYGLYSEMCNDWFWKQEGTMTPQEAAFLAARGLAITEAYASCEGTMTCVDVADCIETSSDVSQALSQYLENSGYGSGAGNYDTPQTYTENELLADGSAITGCDNDNLFGAITQLVDLMNDVLTDTFEQVEVASNYIERTQLLVSGVPAIGLLPIDEFVDFIDQVISSISENYAAQYTTTIRDMYRCDLFCAVKDTCELDFQTFADYFMGKVGATIAIENFNDAINWFITGVWSGSQIVHAAHALICTVLAHGSKFFSIDMAWLSRVVTSSMNDPDSDWTTLCTDCDDIWCYQFDLSAFANYDFSIDGGNQFAGTFAGGKWTTTTANTASGKVTGIFIDFNMSALVGELSGVTHMELEYTAIQGAGVLGTDYAGRVMLRSAANATIYDSLSSAPTQPTWGTSQVWKFAFTGFGITQKIRLLQSVDVTSGTPSGNGEITAFRLYGTGTPPSFANC